VGSVIEALGQQHDPNEWCLFIDSSKQSSKAVLLSIGNKYPSFPVARAVHMKDSYDNMHLLVKHVHCVLNCSIPFCIV
jgi:hypothetical protein